MGKNGDAEKSMTFLEHLEVLRWHIIRAVLSLIVFAVLAFIFKEIIFDYIILAPKSSDFITNELLCLLGSKINASILCINSHPMQLINIKMSGQFMTHIKISLIAGFVCAFPYILWEFWRFIKPALYRRERKYTRGVVFYCYLLFLAGVLFGYFIITPITINFFNTYMVSEEVTNQINLASYISIINSVILASGVIFELPVIIYFLSKLGLITPQFLRKYRRHAIILILILAAIITPPDVFSQILVCIPLIILYEVSIGISKRITRKQAKLT